MSGSRVTPRTAFGGRSVVRDIGLETSWGTSFDDLPREDGSTVSGDEERRDTLPRSSERVVGALPLGEINTASAGLSTVRAVVCGSFWTRALSAFPFGERNTESGVLGTTVIVRCEGREENPRGECCEGLGKINVPLFPPLPKNFCSPLGALETDGLACPTLKKLRCGLADICLLWVV
ncbi:MAG: hypothetical protein VX278_01810 [Myxococcota bacterium]|nr:hypothetical protein [Myxococcota bacterium]